MSLEKFSFVVLFVKNVYIYIFVIIISIKGRVSVGNSILFSKIKRL